MPIANPDEILYRSEIELAFEEGRRRIAPDATSRLSCLWVADDTVWGRHHIETMLRGCYVIKVTVVSIRFTRADSQWVDRYYNNPNPDFIENYWRELPTVDGSISWEYLVDGLVLAIDPAELEVIHTDGAKFPDLAPRYLRA